MAQTSLRIAGESGKPLSRKVAFTAPTLEKATCPAGRDRIYLYDARQPGLALMVTGSGAKSFYLYRKVNGRPKRLRLGGFPDISIEQARKLAAKDIAGYADGKDPMAERRQARVKQQTLGELWTWYLEHHAKPRKRSWKTDEYRWKKNLEGWSRRRLADITTGEVQALITKIGKDHPTGANRVLALLSVMFSKARKNGFDGADPTKGVEKFKERSRERFLGTDELPRFLAALDDEHTSPDWRDYFKLLLLTGARRGNLLSMRWEDVNLERGEWHIPDEASKSGYAMTIALTPAAVEILKARAGNGSQFVFAGTGSTGHLKEPRKAWESILKRAELKDVRLHDLRRTLGSWMAAAGGSLPMIGRHLGHRTPSVTQVYARLALDPVRAVVDAAAAAMLASPAAKKTTGHS